MTSPDGITWTLQNVADDNTLGIAYGNGQFMRVLINGTVTKTSPDGINWTSITEAEANEWQGIADGNGLWVATSPLLVGGTHYVMTRQGGCTSPAGAEGQEIYNSDYHVIQYCNGATG